MENETTAQDGAAANGANGANGHHADVAVEPRAASRPPVRYATDEEAAKAGEKVFRVHHRLLAELAK